MVMHKASRFGIQILEVIHRVPGVEQYVAEVRHRWSKVVDVSCKHHIAHSMHDTGTFLYILTLGALLPRHI